MFYDDFSDDEVDELFTALIHKKYTLRRRLTPDEDRELSALAVESNRREVAKFKARYAAGLCSMAPVVSVGSVQLGFDFSGGWQG